MNVGKRVLQLRRNNLHLEPNILNQIDGQSFADQMNLVLLILTFRPPLKRSQLELDVMVKVLIKFEFFAKLSQTSPSGPLELCRYLKYSLIPQGDVVFNKGETGDQFYIILQGDAGVYLPVEKQPLVFEDELINRLRAGSTFGELSLISDAPRTATIKCLSDCHLGIISKDVFRVILKQAKQKELELKLQFLMSLQFLQHLRKRTLETLVFHFNSVSVTRGTTLCREGEPCKFVYIIQSGEFVLSKNFLMPRGVTKTLESQHSKIDTLWQTDVKKSIEVARLTAGEMYGEIDSLLNESYHFQFTCSSQTAELYAITKQDFTSRIVEHNKSNDMKVFVKQFLKEKVHFRNQRILSIIATLNKTKSFVSGVYRDQSALKGPPKLKLMPSEKSGLKKYNLRVSKVVQRRTEESNDNAKTFFSQLDRSYDQQTQLNLRKKLRNTSLNIYFTDTSKEDASRRRLKTYSLNFMKQSLNSYSNSLVMSDTIEDKRCISANPSTTWITEPPLPRNRTQSYQLPFKYRRIMLSRKHSQQFVND